MFVLVFREASSFAVLQLMTPKEGDYELHTMAVLRAGKFEEFVSLFLDVLKPAQSSDACKSIACMVSQLTSMCLVKTAAKVLI